MLRGTGTKPGPDHVNDPTADGTAVTDVTMVGRVFQKEHGRSVATMIRIFGDIDIAEDAVQEAFAVALRRWPGAGLPPNPGGWITTTSRNCAIDRLRRETRGRELLSELAVLMPGNDGPVREEVDPVEDDRLRLVFTCCHPALSTEAQVALTLRLLGGLSTDEVAPPFSSPRRPSPSDWSAPNARSRRRGSPTGCHSTTSYRIAFVPSFTSPTSYRTRERTARPAVRTQATICVGRRSDWPGCSPP